LLVNDQQVAALADICPSGGLVQNDHAGRHVHSLASITARHCICDLGGNNCPLMGIGRAAVYRA
jgi:hypothetical protein